MMRRMTQAGIRVGHNFGLTGDLGTKKLPQQFSLLSRHDDLPNQSAQDRQGSPTISPFHSAAPR